LWLSRSCEVCELADVVYLEFCPLFTEFASSRAEPGNQLLASDSDRGWLAVVEDRFLLPFKRDAAEPCDQWFPAVTPVGAYLHADTASVRCVDGGPVLGRHLWHSRVIFARKGFEHRGLGGPEEPVQMVDVSGQQVVLDVSSILSPVFADDRMVVEVDHRGATRGLSTLHIRGALGLDRRLGHAQAD